MAFSTPRFSTFTAISLNSSKYACNSPRPSIGFAQFRKYTSFGCRYSSLCCYAAAKQQKGGAPPKKKKPSNKSNTKKGIENDFEIEKSGGGVEVLESPSQSDESPYSALPLPKPPAGFVLDDEGRVLMASNKRIATIVSFNFLFSTLLFIIVLSFCFAFYLYTMCMYLFKCV